MLEHSQIRAILPHAHPMLLVDRVLSLSPGAEIVGIKAITGTEPCYRGLTDGLSSERYAYPTSLLLESFGQTGAVLWLYDMQGVKKDASRVLLFVAARDCRIEGRAFPGDVLRHVAWIDYASGDTVFIKGETWVDNRKIMTVGSMIAATRLSSLVFDSEPPRANGAEIP